MSAPAKASSGKPTLRIRGRSYPVLLPSIRDPRLHLAAVIISLQVLGQVAFDFRLSIAQILVSLLTCAVLEMGIAFRRQHVILWPASALLTGNGVAFILRVPGTEHGDWWSMHGWWIFAGTAAVSLLSKYLIKFRGGHIFNPSNFGLVLCFLLLGPEHADPLEFWWGPMTPWLALAIAIIVCRRARDPPAPAPARDRNRILGDVRREHRRARRERARDDRALAPRAGLGLVLLAGSRLLTRDPRLPLLHDHRPEDDPRGKGRPTGVRRRDRVARGAPRRAADDRVRHEGGRALFPLHRLRRTAADHHLPRPRPRTRPVGARAQCSRRTAGGGGCGGARRRAGVHGTARRRRRPGPFERGRHDSIRRAGERARRGHDRPLGRPGADRPPHGAGDRAGCGRRSPDRVGRPSSTRPRPGNGGSGRRPAGSAVAADPGCEGASDRRAALRRRTDERHPGARRWSVAADGRRHDRRDGGARDVLRLAAHGPASQRPGALLARVRAHAGERPLPDRCRQRDARGIVRPRSDPLRGVRRRSLCRMSPPRSGSTSRRARSTSA